MTQILWQAKDEQERKRKKLTTASLMSLMFPPQIILRGHKSVFLLALGRMFVPGEATDEGIYLQECFSARDSLCRKVTHVLSMLDPAGGS